MRTVRGRLVSDRELICLAGSLVESRGRGYEVCYVDRTPDYFFRGGIVDFACELDSGVPHTAK